MRHRKRILLLIGVTVSLLLSIFVLPVFLDQNSGSIICPIKSALAQEESPCLVQQATISVQEVQILQLQITNNASQLQLLDMQTTLASQERSITQLSSTLTAVERNPTPLIITVPVRVTLATLPDIIVVTATPSRDSSPDPLIQRAEDGDRATIDPQITLPPTAIDSQIEIIQVLGAGDIDEEGIQIRNKGGVIDLTGWTLEDGKGNVFIFPEQRLFTNGLLTVFTRRGTNTPISLYWGRSEAILDNENDFVILSDQDGEVQATYQLSENANE